jgi:ABC-type transport system substrate-binding protein
MRPRSSRLALGAACVLAAPTLTGAPAAADEDSLVYSVMHQPAGLDLADSTAAAIGEWFYNTLYVYDERLSPVPDIAAGPPEISEDGLVWTVELRDDVYFGPTGDQLTAADVAFTYQLANSPECSLAPQLCLAYLVVTPEGADAPVPILQGVEALDDFTVRFTLADVYAPFATEILPGTPITSKDAVEAAFARFEAEIADVAAGDVQALLDAGVEAGSFRADAEVLITAAGLELPEVAGHALEDGSLDEASYARVLEASLMDLARVLRAQETDRIAAAYKHLDTAHEPVGTGPFYVTEVRPGQDITAVRNDLYHHGPAAFETLHIVFIEDDVAGAIALATGEIDWRSNLTANGYAQVERVPGVKFARYPDFGYYALQFNLRPGRLFADKAVRHSLAYCIDKPATVAAATLGWGIPVYSDQPPASWAYNPDVPRYEYDVEKANALLDEAGWVDTDGDGVREKDGRPLASHILLRAGKPDRTKFMHLLADQARDCGFDLELTVAPFPLLLQGLEWPLIMAGQDEQWDAYFGGWGSGYDPNPFALWHSSQCVTEEAPDRWNYICFENERADELIEMGLVELDQTRRAEIYQEFELIMAEELPYLWAWSDQAIEGLRSDIHGAEEWTEETMDSPRWYWQLHRINRGNPIGPE